MMFELSHAATLWQCVSTQRSRMIGAWVHGRPISKHLDHPCLSCTITHARRNGIGKKTPYYHAVRLLFSAHTNFQTPLARIICDRLKCKIHRRDRKNIIFVLITIFSYKTVSKGGKHRVYILQFIDRNGFDRGR